MLRKDLTKHMRTHSGEKPCKCSWCGNFFATNGNLTEHYAGVHRHRRRFKCDKCGNAFPRRIQLQIHVENVHNQPSQMWYKCSHCSEKFLYKFLLTRHLAFEHKNDKRYECVHCGKRFRHQHAQMEHMEVCKHKTDLSTNANNIASADDGTVGCGMCPQYIKTIAELTRQVNELKRQRNANGNKNDDDDNDDTESSNSSLSAVDADETVLNNQNNAANDLRGCDDISTTYLEILKLYYCRKNLKMNLP